MSQPANDDFSQHLSDGEESNHEDASDTGAAPKQPQQMIPQTIFLKYQTPNSEEGELMIYMGNGDGEITLSSLIRKYGRTYEKISWNADDAKEIGSLQKTRSSCWVAEKVIYSLFAKQTEDLDLLHEDLEQIDDVDIEERDWTINWQIAMIAFRT
ncbi:hypothetical protein Tco_1176231 [Tanacetum coccineum]